MDGKITLSAEVADGLPEFACDVEQFERAIINLVENAIKFTPPDGRRRQSRVDCRTEQMIFAVEDTGVGIDQRTADARV